MSDGNLQAHCRDCITRRDYREECIVPRRDEDDCGGDFLRGKSRESLPHPLHPSALASRPVRWPSREFDARFTYLLATRQRQFRDGNRW